MSGTQTTYNDKVVRQFAVMTVIWGIVGMLVGVIIAAQLFSSFRKRRARDTSGKKIYTCPISSAIVVNIAFGNMPMPPVEPERLASGRIKLHEAGVFKTRLF